MESMKNIMKLILLLALVGVIMGSFVNDDISYDPKTEKGKETSGSNTLTILRGSTGSLKPFQIKT